MERGVLCDVYIAVKPHLYVSGFWDPSLNTTVTFWFLSVSTLSDVFLKKMQKLRLRKKISKQRVYIQMVCCVQRIKE